MAWPHIYIPVAAPPPTENLPVAAPPPPVEQYWDKPEIAPEAAPAPWTPPAVEEAPARFVPRSVPAMLSPDPIFEPAIPIDGAAPPVDYTAFRVPTPIPTTPVGKLAALYPKTEAQVKPRPKRRTRPWATRPVGMASIVGVIVFAALAFVVVPKMIATPPTLKTMFTAPMLVLRAVGPGEITNVAVSIGQPVDPSTVLLTIHASPLSDTAVDDLKTKLAQARARQAALDSPGITPATSRQKDAAAAEVEQLQRTIAAASGSGTVDQPILAGVRGIVWSLDAQAGAKLQAGDPLAQLADCGRAFLVIQGASSTLKAGQTVLIRMPGVRPFHGTVRPSAGVAEPPNALVIDPTGFNAASPNACPVGATAEIQPETGR
jgi:biotin carboxyl carrier protein